MIIKEINKEKIKISKMEIMNIEQNKFRLQFELDVKKPESLFDTKIVLCLCVTKKEPEYQ